MFDKGHWPIIMKSVLESADSALKSADSSSDSSTDQGKNGAWVWAFMSRLNSIIKNNPYHIYYYIYIYIYK